MSRVSNGKVRVRAFGEIDIEVLKEADFDLLTLVEVDGDELTVIELEGEALRLSDRDGLPDPDGLFEVMFDD